MTMLGAQNFGKRKVEATSLDVAEKTILMPISEGPFDSVKPAKQEINGSEFYLTMPNEADVKSLSLLAGKRNFFFAPFNNQIDSKVPSITAAAKVIFGETILTHSFAVRASNSHTFLGCVRFEVNRNTKECELSYFFDPDYYRKGLGTQTVLRSLHWLISTEVDRSKLGRIKYLVASVDPENIASYKILTRAGLQVVEGGFSLPEETPYVDQSGNPRSRLIMSGRVPRDILPALEAARKTGHYSLSTLIVK